MPEDIPEVIWLMGIAPGPPVIVLGGVWEVVVGDGLEATEEPGVLEVPELRELDETTEEPTELGFCLWKRWR